MSFEPVAIGPCTMYRGDCLDVLRDVPDGTIDAVITDPPYIIGAVSVGNAKSKSGTWADMENSAYWFAAWMKECKRVLKPTGHLLVFGNWRSVPTLIRGLSLAEMSAHSCLVWDKEWIGPAYKNALRPVWELVIHAAMPDGVIPNRSAPDIVRCKWQAGNMKTTAHPAEKPVELLRHLCRLVAAPGAVVLDPFAGSGTAAEAAVFEGMRFIGIEREPQWIDTAHRRIQAAWDAVQSKAA